MAISRRALKLFEMTPPETLRKVLSAWMGEVVDAIAAGGSTAASAVTVSPTVDGQSNVQDALTSIYGDLTTHEADTAAHGATGGVVGAIKTQTLSNKTFSNVITSTVAAASNALSIVSGAFISLGGSLLSGDGTAVISNKIIQLANIATASLPAAASYKGAVVFDSTTNTFKYSDGSSWISPAGGSAAQLTATYTRTTTMTLTNNATTIFDYPTADSNNTLPSSIFTTGASWKCTPNVAGWYRVDASASVDRSGVNGAMDCFALLYKNGSQLVAGCRPATQNGSGNAAICTVSALVYCNGSTDFFDVRVFQNTTANRSNFTSTGYNVISVTKL